MPSELEQAERGSAVLNAIATQRLEGLEVDRQTVTELEDVARGELSLAEARARVLSRIAAGAYAE